MENRADRGRRVDDAFVDVSALPFDETFVS